MSTTSTTRRPVVRAGRGRGARGRDRSAPVSASPASQRPRPVRTRRTPFVVLVVGLLAGGLLSLLVINTATARQSLRESSLRDRNAALTQQEQELQRQIGARDSDQALAAQAKTLGMVPGGDPVFIVVSRDGKARIVGSPAPATSPLAPPPPPAVVKAQQAAAAKKAAQQKAAAAKKAAEKKAAQQRAAQQQAAQPGAAKQQAPPRQPTTNATTSRVARPPAGTSPGGHPAATGPTRQGGHR